MDVTTLRWFQQVADGATVTEVSELEQVSQSGVSRALARLEDEVGIALLRRSGRTLRLTRAGSAFKRYVDKAVHDLDDGFAALAELASPETGTVSVTFQPSLGAWLVPDLVADFRATHEGVSFALHQVRDTRSGRAVVRGDADVEITTLRPSGEGLSYRALVVEPLRLVVSSEHPAAAGDSVALSDVGDAPFVVLRDTYELRQAADRLCARAGFAPRIAFEGDDIATLTGFVAARLGVAIVPMPRRENSNPSSPVRYLRIEDDAATREIGIIWPAERRLLPAAERFRQHAIDRLPQVARLRRST